MEKDRIRQFTIEKMKVDDLDDANEVRLRSWLDTYPNEEFGISREWIEMRNEAQRSPEKVANRKEVYVAHGANGWLARDSNGEVIGAILPFSDEGGVQHVGSLYVSKEWHGQGVAGKLMQKAIEWANPKKPIELGVVSYNERAKAFYRKWGFEEIPDSETLFADKLPEVRMIRKGDEQ